MHIRKNIYRLFLLGLVTVTASAPLSAQNSAEDAVNDLYAFTKRKYSEWWAKPGDVHYNEAGRNAQGDEVILSTLAENQ